MNTAIPGCSRDVCSYYGVTDEYYRCLYPGIISGCQCNTDITQRTWDMTWDHWTCMSPGSRTAKSPKVKSFPYKFIFRGSHLPVRWGICVYNLQFILAMLESLHSCSTTLPVTLLSISGFYELYLKTTQQKFCNVQTDVLLQEIFSTLATTQIFVYSKNKLNFNCRKKWTCSDVWKKL